MKRLISNMLILLLLLVGLFIIQEHTSWAGEFARGSYLSVDPNEPQPESWFIDRLIYLDEDPNQGENEDYCPE